MNTIGFETELQSLINRHSKENESSTPDFILAHYLVRCLDTWNCIVGERLKWSGNPADVPADMEYWDPARAEMKANNAQPEPAAANAECSVRYEASAGAWVLTSPEIVASYSQTAMIALEKATAARLKSAAVRFEPWMSDMVYTLPIAPQLVDEINKMEVQRRDKEYGDKRLKEEKDHAEKARLAAAAATAERHVNAKRALDGFPATNESPKAYIEYTGPMPPLPAAPLRLTLDEVNMLIEYTKDREAFEGIWRLLEKLESRR